MYALILNNSASVHGVGSVMVQVCMCVVSWHKCAWSRECDGTSVCMCVVSWHKCVHVCSVMVQVCACV